MVLQYFFGEQNEPFILYVYMCVVNNMTTDDLEAEGADSSTAMAFSYRQV